MKVRQPPQNTDGALRSLLQAIQALETLLRAEEGRCDEVHSVVRTTRALIGLIEGWCIDHVMRTGHDVLKSLPPDSCRDQAILANLRRQFEI